MKHTHRNNFGVGRSPFKALCKDFSLIKIFSNICFCFLVMMSTCGCVKISYDMNISNYGKIKLSQTQALNVSKTSGIGKMWNESFEQNFKKEQEKFAQKGFVVSKYKDDKYIGITLIKNYTLDTFQNADLPPGILSKNKVPVSAAKQGNFSTVYSIDWVFDPEIVNSEDAANPDKKIISKVESTDYYGNPVVTTTTLDGEKQVKTTYPDGRVRIEGSNKYNSYSFDYNQKEMNDFGEIIKNSAVMPEAELNIKIPVKAKSHNAEIVSAGNVYKWNINKAEPVPIKLEYEVSVINWKTILGIISIIIVIAGWYFMTRQNDSSWH